MSRGLRNGLVLAIGYFLVLELMLVVAIEFWPDFEKFMGLGSP